MENEGKKFIILENKDQAEEYLKGIKMFDKITPITFNFEAEELLTKYKMNFKVGEKYETPFLYKGIYKRSIELTNEVCKKINIKYRGINLFQLFYINLILFFNFSSRYLRILREIKKKEKIKEIIIFKKIPQNFNDKIFSEIAAKVFKNNLRIIESRRLNKKDSRFLKFAGHLQNVISKIRLNLVKKEENKIFFCGNKKIFENIIEKLNKNKKNKIFRCSDALQKSFFINKRYISFYKFVGLKTKHQKRLIEDIEDFNKKTNNLQFLEDLNLEKELIPVLREWISYYLKFRFLEISGIINKMIKLIMKKKINLIMLYADINAFEKTLAQVGKRFNIPSIVIQHGVIGTEAGFVPKSADYFLAFGKKSKEILINYGYPKKDIVITGSPQFDKYINQKIEKNKQKKIVFIMGPPTDENINPELDVSKEKWKKVYEMLFKALNKFPEYKLIIKWKGKGELDNLPEIIAKKENFQNMRIIDNINPIDLLSDADMVILTNSTMVFDALLLDKPVISINFKELEKFFNYKDLIPVRTVHNQKGLEMAIKKSKTQTKKELLEIKKSLNAELFKLDGGASDRVVNFINKLLLKKK